MTADLKSRYISLKDGQVMSEISKAKAQEESPEKLRARAAALGSKGEILSIIAEVSFALSRRTDKKTHLLSPYKRLDLPKIRRNTPRSRLPRL
jgi:hypothetical protein